MSTTGHLPILLCILAATTTTSTNILTLKIDTPWPVYDSLWSLCPDTLYTSFLRASRDSQKKISKMSPSASGSAQPSILSFFHKQQPPKYASPPTQTQTQTQPPPPPPPPSQPPLAQAPTALQPSSHSVIAEAAAAKPTPIPSPHPSATILPVDETHIPALRRINALLLPVNYTDGFYNGLLDPSVSGLFSRAILWRDDDTPAAPPKVIGGIVCRLEPTPFRPETGRYDAELARRLAASASPPHGNRALYVQSLVLLAPYRGLGLAAAALEGICAAVAAAPPALRVECLYAHVWTQNEDGLAWYRRRGFETDARLEKYYMKLLPDSAWVVKRRIGGAVVPADGAAHELSAAGPVPASVTAAAVNLPGFAANGTPAAAAAGPPPSGPPRNGTAGRPPPPSTGLSFQNKRPDMEWNDLPEEMVSSSKNSSRSDLLAPPASGSSSRSSSATGRKKRDRAYPTAAFGS